MSAQPNSAYKYQVGGTLPPDAPTYSGLQPREVQLNRLSSRIGDALGNPEAKRNCIKAHRTNAITSGVVLLQPIPGL